VTESASNNHSPVVSTAEPSTEKPISTKPLVSQRTRRTSAIIGAIVFLVVVAGLVALAYFAYTAYDRVPVGVVSATARFRDMSIIVIALETLVLMLLVLFVIVLLVVMVIMTYDRVIPLLEQMNRTMNTVGDTVQTVRGTTTFVSEKLVSPVIEVSSYAAGVARILKGIIDLLPRRSGNGRQPPE
jgi:hypothetical protein